MIAVALAFLAASLWLAALLAFVAERMERRPSRRDVARAHSTPLPFDWQRDEEAA